MAVVASLVVSAPPAGAQVNAEPTLSAHNGPYAVHPDTLLRSSPEATAVRGHARVDVAVQGPDAYQWTYWTGAEWTGWRTLGRPPVGMVESSPPAIVSWAPGRLDVFVRGADGDLWQRFSNDGGDTWSPWIEPVGDDGELTSAPTVVALSGPRLAVYVVGTDGQIWERYWTGTSWDGWYAQGKPATTGIVDAPAGVSHDGTHVDLFVRGGDDDLWQRNWSPSVGWSDWFRPVGDRGVLASGPGASSWAPGTLQVAVRGTDGGIWVLSRANAWSHWMRLGGPEDQIVGAPGLSARGFGAFEAFGRGTGNRLIQFWTDRFVVPDRGVVLTQRCNHDERDVWVDVQYPQGWHVNSGDAAVPCTAFDPDPVQISPGTEFPRELAVVVRVEPQSFDRATDPDGLRVESERALTVDGRQAVRQTVVSTGEGLGPAGLRSLRYLIDAGAERVVIAATYDVAGNDFSRSVEVLDEMVAAFDLTPASGDGGEGAAPVGDPGFQTVEAGGFPAGGDQAMLVDVRIGSHGTFDRIVLEFAGDETPSYRVGYVEPPVREDGSGNEVAVEGDAFLELRLAPASGVDLSGPQPDPTYTGPTRIDPGATEVVTEVVRIGDFEGQLAWVAGLEQRQPFGVTMLEDPVRLVVDVVTG
ncbi:MAG: hypothetical protein ACLGI2_11150 [Acidimicrobiia bacterium]